jgi:hypothetical protein
VLVAVVMVIAAERPAPAAARVRKAPGVTGCRSPTPPAAGPPPPC